MSWRFAFYGQRSALTIVERDSNNLYVGFVWIYPRAGLREPTGPPRAATQFFASEAEAWQASQDMALRFLHAAAVD
jgi:hypothetical protein